MSLASPLDPATASLQQLRTALDSRAITSERLTRFYLQRIERFDQHGPRLNTLITLNPDVLRQAAQLDAASAQLTRKPPLYGIPFIVKDNFDTAELATSGGSRVLAKSIPSANAYVVQKLLDQGALLLGKANMSELAASYGRLGYSSAGGLTLNPYNRLRNASGSSSGSAAAVAAGFAAFALGTDTGGSVRAPAAVTGLVGLRPTIGLLSRNGIIPASLSFDTAGILAHHVQDVQIVLAAIQGSDPADEATLSAPGIADDSPANPRVGVIVNFRGANAEVDAAEQLALQLLRRSGATLVEVTLPAEFETLDTQVLDPLGEAEFRAPFERYLRRLQSGMPRTLPDFIAAYAAEPLANSATPINPARLAALQRAVDSPLTDSPRYIRILRDVIPALRAKLESVIVANRLQVLAFPTMSCPASPRFDREDPTYECGADDPYRPGYVASATGFPEVTVPLALTRAGVPLGYSFMASPFHETQLLRLAAHFAQFTPRISAPILR